MSEPTPELLRNEGPTLNRQDFSSFSDDQFRSVELTFNQLMLSRQMLFTRLFDPRRNIEDECGYPQLTTTITVELYKQLYDRDGIALRIVEMMPKESWEVSPLVYETEDSDEPTDFEEDWDNLGKSLGDGRSWYQDEEGGGIWEMLKRVDILSGIGHFGVLLLGFDDGRPLDQPVDGVIVTNAHGKRLGDSWLARGEEAGLLQLPGLTANERSLTAKWADYRNAVTQHPTFNSIPPDDEPALLFNFYNSMASVRGASSGQATPFGQSLLGTDQQYFGVVSGPPEQAAPEPATEGRKLIFLRAFDESLVQIVRYEWNIMSPRFGLPVMYRITLNDPREQHSGVGLPLATVFVHWSRVIHIADTDGVAGSSNVFAVPRMRPSLNRVLDLRKVYGASGEAVWRGAIPQYTVESNPQMGPDVIYDKDKMKDLFEQWQNGFQRIMTLVGFGLKAHPPQVVDLTSHKDMHLEAICIQMGYPIRVFKGSERGELASAQDDEAWNDRKRGRQLGYLTPRVLVPFVDRLIMAGVLREPKQGRKRDKSTKPGKKGAALKLQPPASGGGGKPPGAEGTPNPAAGASGGTPKPAPKPSMNRQSNSGDGVIHYGVANVRHVTRTMWSPVLNAAGQPVTDPTTGEPKVQPKEVETAVTDAAAGYSIEWPAVDALGKKDKAGIGLQKTQAAAAYVAGNVEQLIPPHDYLVEFLGFSEERADAILTAAEEAQADKEQDQQDAADEQGFEPLPPPGFHDPSVPPAPVAVGAGETMVHPHTGEVLAKGQPLPKGTPLQPVPTGNPAAAGGPPSKPPVGGKPSLPSKQPPTGGKP